MKTQIFTLKTERQGYYDITLPAHDRRDHDQ